ncbi:hypothetical protein Hanom_Chr07g00607991 [Helianthus anomalus]
MIVGLSFLLACCPAQALGQFFHSQCVQSMLPIIPQNPRSSPTWSNLAKSLSLGFLRHC